MDPHLQPTPDATGVDACPGSIRRYLAVDFLMMGYALLVFGGVVLLGGDLERRVEIMGVHLGLFILVRMGVPWLRRSPVRWVRYVTDFYPMFTFAFLYAYASLANRMLFPSHEPFDRYFRNLDLRLFGVEPSLWLHEKLGNVLLDEIISAGYFSYYALFPVVGVVIHYKAKREAYHEFLFTLCLTFVVSYLTFIVLPVWGPCLARGDDYQGLLFIPMLDFIYSHAETGGGAFPSSHVAIAVVCMLFARRHAPRLFLGWLPAAITLVFATVYCRYHYAVDSVAGLVWGVMWYGVGVRLYAVIDE